jgi:hypothetical protein
MLGVRAWGFFITPKGLKRIYGQGHLHFITFSCYRSLPLLRSARGRNVFVRSLDRALSLDGPASPPLQLHASTPSVGHPQLRESAPGPPAIMDLRHLDPTELM